MQAASKIARSSVRAAQAQRGSAAAAGRALSSKTGHAASDGTFRAYNFSAGPACVDTGVLETAQSNMLSHEGSGVSFMEFSHRDAGGPVQKMMNSVQADFRSLLDVPDNYEVLLFQGGAHGQFAAVPLNLVGTSGGKADFIHTGFWCERAENESKKYVECRRAYDAGVDNKFTTIADPSKWDVDNDAAFVHVCANETIHGLEFLKDPSLASGQPPMILDATSTLLSRPMDISQYGAVYASSGKNLGPAGLCVAIVRKDLVEQSAGQNCPGVLSWHEAANSAPIQNIYNTPPTYLHYLLSLVLDTYKQAGGLEAMEQRAVRLSEMLYETIDGSGGFYSNPVDETYRSRMNVPFRINGGDKALEDLFTQEAKDLGYEQVFGHPLFGGQRITLYNMVPEEGVNLVNQFMLDFKTKHAQ